MFCLSKTLCLISCPRSRKRTNALHSQDDPLTRSEEFLIAPPTHFFHRKPLPSKPIRLETIPELRHIVYTGISAQSNDAGSSEDEGEGQPIASFKTGWYEVLNDADSEQWVFDYVNDTLFGITWPLRRVRKARVERSKEEKEDGERESVEDIVDKTSADLDVYEEGEEGCGTLSRGYEADDELTIGTLITAPNITKTFIYHYTNSSLSHRYTTRHSTRQTLLQNHQPANPSYIPTCFHPTYPPPPTTISHTAFFNP
jgi:hypothetical protein